MARRRGKREDGGTAAAGDAPGADGTADVPAPPPAKRRKGPLWAKLMVGFGVLLMAASAGGVVAAKALTGKVNDAVQQEDLLGEQAVAQGVDYVSGNGPLNFLMIGTDSRDPGDVDAEARTDTIMVLHIPKGLDKAYLISIPRDLWVDIPRCWDGQTACKERVNAAYVFGGDTRAQRFKLLAETVKGFTGLSFDGAAIINFASFQEVVDLVGGVELCLEETITSIHTYKTFEKGCREYDAEDALDIVRQRKMYADGDFARQRMQQRFVKSLMKKAEEEGYMSDPTKITSLIERVGATLTVQCPTGMLPTDVAYTLRAIKPSALTMVKVPTYPRNIGGADVLLAEDTAEDLWAAVKDDGLEPFLAEHPDLVNKDVEE